MDKEPIVDKLLERQPPEDYLQQWSTILAAENEKRPEEGLVNVLIFRVGAEWLAVDSSVVRDIVESASPHPLPHRTGHVIKGLVNIRGQLRLMVSLADLLQVAQYSIEEKATEKFVYKRMVVLGHDDCEWAFPVDEVYKIVRMDRRSLNNAPVNLEKGRGSFLRGIFHWRGKEISYLEEELLFHSLQRGDHG